MKNTSLVIVLLMSLLGMSNCEKGDVTILAKRNKKLLNYKIINTGKHTIYVPVKYYLKKTKDTLIMEAIYKADLKHGELPLSYNAFLPPVMKKIAKKASLTFDKVLYENVDLHNYILYFRVYTKSDTLLFGKSNEYSNKEKFLDFEKMHSTLVRAEIN